MQPFPFSAEYAKETTGLTKDLEKNVKTMDKELKGSEKELFGGLKEVPARRAALELLSFAAGSEKEFCGP